MKNHKRRRRRKRGQVEQNGEEELDNRVGRRIRTNSLRVKSFIDVKY